MTTPYDDDDDQDQTPNWRRKLEQEAKEGREAKAALEAQNANTRAIQQELAMRRAGIDPADPIAALLAKANPELIDQDGIKAEWDKLRPAAPAVPAEQQAAMQRIQAAQAGGDPGGGATPDFNAELDAIPMVRDGQYNPDYVAEVLTATQIQAAREGREFAVIGGGEMKLATPGPAVTPLA